MGLDVRIVADQTAAQAEPLRPQAGALHVVWRAMLKNRKAMAGAVILSIFVLVALVPGILAPFDPHAQIFEQTLPPSREHLLGTTGNGQDIFSQLIWGTRESLAIAIVAGLMATVLSVLVGVSSAYLGGLGDHRQLPGRGALRGAGRRRSAIHRAGQSQRYELGNNALLGTKQRRIECRFAALGNRAGPLHRARWRGLRLAQLRLRRDHEPCAPA